ncbi:MAG: aminoacyl-tRNA hydrolase [Magnetococcales bacterium]|nr:aminoacyl-tRNA hydrolase [Magnetococcales bacterium]
MKLLVGLGNPGSKYQDTRHNLGFDALDQIADYYRLSAGGVRFRGRFGDGRIETHRVFSLMPDTYMNRSGLSVAEAARFYKIPVEDIVVFHDDLDLALGKIRIKKGGGNAGHNGLRSIQQMIGSADFVRVRLGIGRPPPGWNTADFVLARFTGDEKNLVEARLRGLAKVVPAILDGAFPAALNKLALDQ